MSKVLQEYIPLKVDKNLVKESIEQKKPIVLRGIFQRADAVNENGRIYPRSILEREVENYKKLVSENRALGAVDHPNDSVVSLKDAGHIVREIGFSGNEVVGSIEILNTPSGNIIKSLLESGVSIGISSRGVGDVTRDDNGNDIVEDNFCLLAFDTVSLPSTQGAYLSEGKNVSMKEVISNLNKRDRVNRIVNEILLSK